MQGGNARNLSCSFAFEGKAPAGALTTLGLRGSFVYLGRGYEYPISGRRTAYAPIWLPCKRPSAALFSPTRRVAYPFIFIHQHYHDGICLLFDIESPSLGPTRIA